MKKKDVLMILFLVLILVATACGPTASSEPAGDELPVNELPDSKPAEGLRPFETDADADAASEEAYPAPSKEDAVEAEAGAGEDGYPAPLRRDEAVASDDDAYPAPPTDSSLSENEATIGEAMIEGMELLVMESFPVQVNIAITGMLPDGCTTVGPIEVEQEDDTFNVTVRTTRPADMLCTQIVTEFEESIPLDVEGLAAGTYTVNVNGFTGTFTLDVDNG